MKKKLVIVFGLLSIGITFASTIEASAKELDGPECPAGYYFKKVVGLQADLLKQEAIVFQWEILEKLDNSFNRRHNWYDK